MPPSAEIQSCGIPASCAVLSVAEAYAADQAAARAGVETLKLMEKAGTAVARAVQARWAACPVAILCGPGNNGGDGFVAARALAQAGWPVRVFLAGDVDGLRGDAAVNAKRWQDRGEILPLAPGCLDDNPVVVDALFGAGVTRPPTGAARRAIEDINARNLPCIAVDLPSGVNGDSGCLVGADEGIAPRCVSTVTFFRPKPAHFLYPARALCGELIVADIGIPESVLDGLRPRTAHNEPSLWSLPTPAWDDHKYSRGYAVVFGGAHMTGAARLAARAARRMGAGLLRLVVPAGAEALYSADAPGAFVEGIGPDGDTGTILVDPRRNGVLIGPGLGVGPHTRARVREVLAAGRATVLDADALTSFADDPKALFTAVAAARSSVVLTPHDGEFYRIFSGIEGSRLVRARAAAERSGATVVLKGADTVVAAPDGRAAIASNAPPWLATGGSGDVLAGAILGLLVQGMPAWQAACAAVWLHGAAGGRLGRGLIAEDLPEALAQVVKTL